MALQNQMNLPQDVEASPTQSPSAEEIQAWLVAHLAEALEIEAQQIKPDQDFTEYGLDSITMVNLSGELELFLNRRLDPTLVLNYPNIQVLSEHLAETETAVTKSPQQQEAEQLLATMDQMSDEEVEGLLGTLLSESEDE